MVLGYGTDGVDVTRWRRPGAGEILLAYLVLAAAGGIVGWLSRAYGPHQDPVSSFPVTAFLAWRVSRGGWISRALLILGSLGSCASAVLEVARMWDAAVVVLFVIAAAQFLLITSLPVYGRTGRPEPVLVRAEGWTQLVWRPPAWLLPWGLLAGAGLTMALLGSMTSAAIPGCDQAAAGACTALAEGYPLRWLTADQGFPVIFKGALLRDYVQWALACTSVLYLVARWLTDPAGPRD
jgi:hypothetical protein